MKKGFNGLGIWLIIAIVTFIIITMPGQDQIKKTENEYTYGNLVEEIEAGNSGNIAFIEVSKNESSEEGLALVEFNDGEKKEIYIANTSEFIKILDNKIVNDEFDASKYNVKKVKSFGWVVNIIPTILMVVLFIFILNFFLNSSQGGSGGKVMNFGKSKAKIIDNEKNKIKFADVAGLQEEKEEVKEIVEFLKNPKKFINLGARIPKGFLLVGPPGTGKTLLAKAVAGEAEVPFFTISGSDFVEMFVGVGASRVRDLFEQAKKNSPSVIFIDEIDAVGRRRGAGLGGGHDEREQTLNQMLVEMDGFSNNEGVIVMAATNRSDILDPALLRPGRFDRRVVVGRPDVKGREEILNVHAKGKKFEDDVDLEEIAKMTSGFTGADLENLLNESAILAARADKEKIDMTDIRESFIKVGIGTEKKSRIISDKEKRITAYHEAGHAIIHEVLSELDMVHSVSIIPTGFAGGYTMPIPGEDKWYVTKTKMEQEIVALLGGRAAEKIIFNDITTGASNDIERATEIARNMVSKYGMSDKVGPIKYGEDKEEVFVGRDYGHLKNYSEQVATLVDTEMRAIIEKAYLEATRILEENMEVLHEISNRLIEKEKISGEEIEIIFIDKMGEAPKSRDELKKEKEKKQKAKKEERIKSEEAEAKAKAEIKEEPKEEK